MAPIRATWSRWARCWRTSVKPGEAAPFAQSPSSNQGHQDSGSGQWTAVTAHICALRPRRHRDPRRASHPRLCHPRWPTISPRARRVAAELGVDWSQLTGSGRTGRIVERDIRAAAEARCRSTASRWRSPAIRATPVAARLAQEAGHRSGKTLAAQKPGQRIEREDVEAAIAAQRPPRLSLPASPTRPGERIPTTRIRRLIAQRMAESAHTTASVTLTTEADATEFVALRDRLKVTLGSRNLPVPSYNDLLIKLAAVALQNHPNLNATWQENEILLHQSVHVGLAVDTERGLLVPVVRDAHAKKCAPDCQRPTGADRPAPVRQLSPDDLQGAAPLRSPIWACTTSTPLRPLSTCRSVRFWVSGGSCQSRWWSMWRLSGWRSGRCCF